MILFRDFDGVLHPEAAYLYGKTLMLDADGALFMWANLLVDALADRPDVRIVLSTSWVRLLSFNRARDYLPPVLRARVIGGTWHSAADRWEWEQMTQHQQIRRYVNRNRVTHWLALDDDNEKWGDADRDRLILCHPDAGLSDPAALPNLRNKLRAMT